MADTNISKAAAALGKRGGSVKSEAKAISSAANGKRGGRGHINWYRRAQDRVDHSPQLKPHEDFIMADWPEGEEHWRWVSTATVGDILTWVAKGQ